MVIVMSKFGAKVRDLIIETNGDIVKLRTGKREDFHVISPETDSERMRMVGALGEILYEQIKKTFGANSLFLVAQHKDFKLVMFPSEEGFTVWKTNLDLARILSATHTVKTSTRSIRNHNLVG